MQTFDDSIFSKTFVFLAASCIPHPLACSYRAQGNLPKVKGDLSHFFYTSFSSNKSDSSSRCEHGRPKGNKGGFPLLEIVTKNPKFLKT